MAWSDKIVTEGSIAQPGQKISFPQAARTLLSTEMPKKFALGIASRASFGLNFKVKVGAPLSSTGLSPASF
jgi:hypothetical protein